MSARAFDTNVLIYLLKDGPKCRIAREAIAGGGVISVQVLNEITNVCRRKLGMGWDEIAAFTGLLRGLLWTGALTEETHDLGRALAERYGFSFYDALIVAVALIGGCDTLLSEDMHDGLLVEGQLTIRNPFRDLGEAGA